jgi:hypothetical protein
MHRRDALGAALGLVVAGDVVAATNPGESPHAPLTAFETAAGVRSVDASYVPGDVRRYGALGDGRTDDAPAWRTALATGHTIRGGGAGNIYRVESALRITRSTVVELEGATLKPIGKTQAFVRNAPGPTAASDTLGGTARGSRFIKVQDPSGFRSGQLFRLSLNDQPKHDPSSYPPNWTRIAGVAANVIELETPLQVDYGDGPAKAMAYDPSLLIERFECLNGIFDGSESTHDVDTGQALRIGGVENVVVRNCEFRGFANAAELTCPLEIYVVIDALVDGCRFTGGVSNFNACDMQEARSARFTNNVIDGAHFGCNITRVDAGLFAHNTLQGRRNRETTQNLRKARSVRGLKAMGCAAIRILGNHAADYESPVKVEACFRYDVSHNIIMNAGLRPYEGQIALNIGSIQPGINMRGGTIIGNQVETCGGIGIGVTSDSIGGVIIANNIVRSTQAVAIHAGVANAMVVGNRIEDWGLRGSADPGIRFAVGATIADNRFSNTLTHSAPCMGPVSTGGSSRVMRDNVSESSNPLS